MPIKLRVHNLYDNNDNIGKRNDQSYFYLEDDITHTTWSAFYMTDLIQYNLTNNGVWLLFIILCNFTPPIYRLIEGNIKDATIRRWPINTK